MTEIKPLKHSLLIDDCRKLTVNGITNVDSISDKEVELKLSSGNLIIKGSNLNANKLSIEDGTIVIDCDAVYSLTYSKGAANKQAFKLSSLLK